ncbi:hypothetical protein [Dubosiella newyorkensis]|uniref:hypothetical protein n=1 Tax=Dubosiella newyorkensis TaxID=1862672 RepID=UPI0024BBC0DF|nr:hypothetical protein [Dubosiella newyorkensis]
MKLSKREREALALSIQQENEMLKRVGKIIRNSFVALAVFLLLFYWGYSGIHDVFFPNLSASGHQVIKWIGIIGSIASLAMLIFSLTARHYGKKNVLKKIDKYQGRTSS